MVVGGGPDDDEDDDEVDEENRRESRIEIGEIAMHQSNRRVQWKALGDMYAQ